MDYVNTIQAGKYLSISPTRVAVLIRQGRLKAEKISNTWLILRADLEEFAKRPRPDGWKKGRPRKIN